MIGPAAELLDIEQSIVFELQSNVDVGGAINHDKNFELELLNGANLHFEFNFHKHLIAKGIETFANISQKTE